MYSSTFTYKSVKLYGTESGGVGARFIADLLLLICGLIYEEVPLLMYSALLHLGACVNKRSRG